MSKKVSPNKEAGNRTQNVSPQQEPAATPLISVADVPLEAHPVVHLPDHRRYIIEAHAARIADNWPGKIENHITGKLGEDALANHLGITHQIDLDVYADEGDGGWDIPFQGAKIEVKTLTRRNSTHRQLRVNVYKPLTAEYYVLVSRIGPGDFRLIGYAPRTFVANARQKTTADGRYHIVDEEYLFPFLRIFTSTQFAS